MYLPWNDVIANFIDSDLELPFQGKKRNANILKTVRASENVQKLLS